MVPQDRLPHQATLIHGQKVGQQQCQTPSSGAHLVGTLKQSPSLPLHCILTAPWQDYQHDVQQAICSLSFTTFGHGIGEGQ